MCAGWRSWFRAASSWTLPLYELAIMTARHGWAIGIDGAQYWFVTPEPEPLAIFGARAGRAVHEMLEPEGITFIGSACAEVRQGTVLLDRRQERIEADRIVCLPLLDGPRTPGVPTDSAGFIAVDADGGVSGVPDAYAVGDATTFPIKQGGLACQQADAVAELIAAAAGARAQPRRFRPVLRGKLMTGGRDRFLHRRLAGKRAQARFPSSRCGGRRPRSQGAISPHISSTPTSATVRPSEPRLAIDAPLDGFH